MSKLTQAINPPTLVKPAGYSRVAGQVAVDRDGRVVGADDLVAGQMNDIVKPTIHVLSRSAYKARAREIGAVYDDGGLIEIEAVAVVG